MRNFYKTIQSLENKLKDVKFSDPIKYSELEHAILACTETLGVLRTTVEMHGFKDSAHEIEFFKNIKPKIVGYMNYFMNLILIQTDMPLAGKKLERKFFKDQITLLQNYFRENQELYEYYLRGHTDKDLIFSLRKSPSISFHIDSIAALTDGNFATSHDSVFAKFHGNQLTIDYLKRKLDVASDAANAPNAKSLPSLKWSGSKVALVELIYALHASGLINQGHAEIKELAKAFEIIFEYPLDDIYRAFLEIRTRKTTPTKLLDILKTSLINKMVEADG